MVGGGWATWRPSACARAACREVKRDACATLVGERARLEQGPRLQQRDAKLQLCARASRVSTAFSWHSLVSHCARERHEPRVRTRGTRSSQWIPGRPRSLTARSRGEGKRDRAAWDATGDAEHQQMAPTRLCLFVSRAFRGGVRVVLAGAPEERERLPAAVVDLLSKVVNWGLARAAATDLAMEHMSLDRLGFGAGDWSGVAALAAGTLGLAVLYQVALEILTEVRYRGVPGPGGRLPLLGHALELAKGNIWVTLGKWTAKHGSLCRIFVMNKVFIIVSETDHIKHMFQTNVKNYPKDTFSYGAFDCLLGNGIVLSEGERWHALRRQLAPTFKLEILDDVGDAAMFITRRMFPQLDAAAERGEEVDMAEVFRKATLQVISKAVIGLSPEESDDNISHLYLPIIEECNDRSWCVSRHPLRAARGSRARPPSTFRVVLQLLWLTRCTRRLPWRAYLPTAQWFRHRDFVRRLNAYVGGKVSERLARKSAEGAAGRAPKPKDILDRIVWGASAEEVTEQWQIELRDGLKTFLFAGHDTTACMLTWTIFYLVKGPEHQQVCAATPLPQAPSPPPSSQLTELRVQVVLEEARALFPADDSTPPFSKLANALPKTFNMLRESLRIRPPVPMVVRSFSQADTIGGHTFPAGTKAMVLLQAAHKNPVLWPKGDVDVFRPARFGEAETTSPQTGLGENIDAWSFLPFINGPRNCLGQHFSLLEARVILGLLCQRYEFLPSPGLVSNSVATSLLAPTAPHHLRLAADYGMAAWRRMAVGPHASLPVAGRADRRDESHPSAALKVILPRR